MPIAFIEQLYAARRSPDVILMDIRMPHMDGIAATRIVKDRWPASHIVILTTFDDIELIQAGLHAGAQDYLLKDVTAEQLATTIRVATSGQTLLQPKIASKVFAALASPPAAPASSSVATTTSDWLIEQLTERERAILALVAQGSSNRQIGEILFIIEGTVKNHLSNILGKMGMRDRSLAALKAKELGLT